MKPWYAKTGLRFRCLPDCGMCCAEKGWVFFTFLEAGAAAEYLNTTVDTLVADGTFVELPTCYSAKHIETGACRFLKDGKCSIYPVRPTQCVTFPFWWTYLTSPEAWTAAIKRCPGCGVGPVHSAEEIETAADTQARSMREIGASCV